MARSGRAAVARAPSYPTYTPPPRPSPAGYSAYDSYEAEKNKSFKSVHFSSFLSLRGTNDGIELLLLKEKACNSAKSRRQRICLSEFEET